MSGINSQNKNLADKKSGFDHFTEAIGWLQIVASPLLLAAIIGSVVYFSRPTKTTLIAGIVITSIGLAIGIIWATRVWKRKGTMRFMSGNNVSPELDKE